MTKVELLSIRFVNSQSLALFWCEPWTFKSNSSHWFNLKKNFSWSLWFGHVTKSLFLLNLVESRWEKKYQKMESEFLQIGFSFSFSFFFPFSFIFFFLDHHFLGQMVFNFNFGFVFIFQKTQKTYFCWELLWNSYKKNLFLRNIKKMFSKSR